MSLLPRSVPDAGESVLDETGLGVARDRVWRSTKELTGAQYAVLCVLNGAGWSVRRRATGKAWPLIWPDASHILGNAQGSGGPAFGAGVAVGDRVVR